MGKIHVLRMLRGGQERMKAMGKLAFVHIKDDGDLDRAVAVVGESLERLTNYVGSRSSGFQT